MSQKIEVETSKFYCNLAMSLCQVALSLYAKKQYKKGAKICKFVSTLCAKKPHEKCQLESKYCYTAGTLYEQGKIEEASKYCKMSRTICPRNFRVSGE